MTEMSAAEAIFFAAAALPTSERASYLAHVCAGRDDLRQRVEQMLAAQPLPLVRTRDQLAKGRRQRRRIARGHEEPALPMPDDVQVVVGDLDLVFRVEPGARHDAPRADQ